MQDYAESLIDSVLMPVADGAKNLCPEDQLSAMETVLESICNSWKKYFLQRKVKFRSVRKKYITCDCLIMCKSFNLRCIFILHIIIPLQGHERL